MSDRYKTKNTGSARKYNCKNAWSESTGCNALLQDPKAVKQGLRFPEKKVHWLLGVKRALVPPITRNTSLSWKTNQNFLVMNMMMMMMMMMMMGMMTCGNWLGLRSKIRTAAPKIFRLGKLCPSGALCSRCSAPGRLVGETLPLFPFVPSQGGCCALQSVCTSLPRSSTSYLSGSILARS